MRETRKEGVELIYRARNLDPADCVDPNRCQSISLAQGDISADCAGRHLHEAPASYHH